MEIKFVVESSSGSDTYSVRILKRGENSLSAFCTCPAGENGTYCKHRMAIFAGDTSAILSANKEQVSTVKEWLKGSDVEKHISIIEQLEIESDKLKKAISSAKKELAKAMRG